MQAEQPLAESWRTSVSSRCSSLSTVSSSRSIAPITPYIGVRISWLITARNSDFSRVASSAWSRASSSSSSACFWSVISR